MATKTNCISTMKLISHGSALLLLAAALPAQAVTYICQVNGQAVYSTEQINKNCTVSQTGNDSRATPDQPVWVAASGITSTAPASKPVLQKNAATNDVKIVAPAAQPTTGPAPRMVVKLRNQSQVTKGTVKNSKDPLVTIRQMPAPVLALPKPKPQLSRKQILQNEVRNEQTALVRARAQLNVARKKGDKAKINRLEQAVRDREANISAIKGEMSF